MYLLPPGFQPFPMTKFPLSPDHLMLNLPPWPFVVCSLGLPSLHEDQKYDCETAPVMTDRLRKNEVNETMVLLRRDLSFSVNTF